MACPPLQMSVPLSVTVHFFAFAIGGALWCGTSDFTMVPHLSDGKKGASFCSLARKYCHQGAAALLGVVVKTVKR